MRKLLMGNIPRSDYTRQAHLWEELARLSGVELEKYKGGDTATPGDILWTAPNSNYEVESERREDGVYLYLYRTVANGKEET